MQSCAEPNRKTGKDKAEFDEKQRRSFLLNVKSHKKIQRKKAEKLAKETLRKTRAVRRNKRKEEREEVVKDILRSQAKLGIKALPIFAEEEKKIEVAEIDAANPVDVKVKQVDLI